MKAKKILAVLMAAGAVFFGQATISEANMWDTYYEHHRNDYESLKKQANDILYYQRYKEAMNIYLDLLRWGSGKNEAYYLYVQIGRCWNGLKGYNKAIEYCNKSINIRTNYAEAYFYRGVAYQNLAKYNFAIADYNKALEINPYYSDAYFGRAWIYEKNRKYHEAIADYTKVIELKFEPYVAYNNRGWNYEKLKQYDLALKDYQKAVEIKPNYEIAKGNLNRLLKKMK